MLRDTPRSLFSILSFEWSLVCCVKFRWPSRWRLHIGSGSVIQRDILYKCVLMHGRLLCLCIKTSAQNTMCLSVSWYMMFQGLVASSLVNANLMECCQICHLQTILVQACWRRYWMKRSMLRRLLRASSQSRWYVWSIYRYTVVVYVQ